MKRITVCAALSIAALMAVGGCASAPSNPEDVAEMNRPLICEGKAQCDLWWRRAQVWVSQHAGFKIQTATDTIIETYNPPEASARWAFRVTREPMSGTSDRLWLSDSCGQIKLCPENRAFVVANFKRYVRGPAIAVAAAASPASGASQPD